MKKFKKLLSIALCGAMLLGATSAIGCQPPVTDGIDPNKTQIYVALYNGGLGTKWFDSLRKEWNANNEEYQVVPLEDKLDASEVKNGVNGVQTKQSPSIYFSVAAAEFKDLVENEKLQDITPLLSYKPDGEEGLTIEQKLNSRAGYLDSWKTIASHTTKGGFYLLPWNDAVHGFVYDHDTALDPKGTGNPDDMWLFAAENSNEVKQALTAQGISYTEDGDYLKFVSSTGETNYKAGGIILRAGRDNKYGTYDDGQPISPLEWEVYLGRVRSSGYKTFMWTGAFKNYTNWLNAAFIAQYSGVQSVVDFYDHDSNNVQYEMQDGSYGSFTIDDGYKSFGMMGIKKSLEFYKSYLDDGTNIHDASIGTTKDHGATQGLFVMGYRNASSNPKTAMLVEGSWWENEARVHFISNVSNGQPERGYGKRDYRYMVTPDFEGGVGPWGTGKGAAMALSECSSFFVTRQTDENKLNAIYDFLSFTLKEENLRKYTVETGVVRPYVYNLTAEDKVQMTPFAKNNWQLYKDSENIALVSTSILECQPLTYATVGFKALPIPFNKGTIIEALHDGNRTAEAVANGIKTAYTQSSWNTYLSQARENGFYPV